MAWRLDDQPVDLRRLGPIARDDVLTEDAVILIPAYYDVVWGVFSVLTVALLIVSIVTLVRTKTHSDAARVGWTVVVVFLPILGSAAWLVTLWASRRPARRANARRMG